MFRKIFSSKEEKFWNWFISKEHLYFYGTDHGKERSKIFNDLSAKLKQINKELVFEFGPLNENRRELFISADGLKREFQSVRVLIEAAPNHPNWIFTAFRQRSPGDKFSIEIGDIKFCYSDLYFRHIITDGKLGIELNIKNYQGKAQEQNAIYILLDGLLGELDVANEIDWIDWETYSESENKKLDKIIDLRYLIDKLKKEKADNMR